LGNIWRDSSARGDLRAEFDRSQVARGSVGRAVEPGATGEPYPSHGLGMDPAPVRRLDAFPQNGYGGVMSHATVEARQMYSAGAGTGLAGLPPNQRAPASGPPAEEAGYGIPHDLQQPNGSSGARTHPVQGVNAEPRGAIVLCTIHPGDQTVRLWVKNPSVASGVSSFPVTPDSAGFIAEARERAKPVMLSLGPRV